jgi:plasmid stabilization system protein ParE
MSRIDWTVNLEKICGPFTLTSHATQNYADGVISRIKARTRRLRAWPLSGSIVPEWNTPELREVYSGQYRIIYRAETERVLIVTVLHGARQLPENP